MKKKILTVEKIGGTSMSAFDDVITNIIIGSRKKTALYNRIFVVSAYSGVTNLLLEHKKTGIPGIYEKFHTRKAFHKAMDGLLKKLLKINLSMKPLGLPQKTADAFITKRILATRNYLDSMADVLTSGYINEQSILLAAREMLASIGEAHSAFNSVQILKSKKINATFVDLSGIDDPEFLTIDERIHKEMQGIDFSKTITFVTGYAKGSEGIMREFDRGYSEVTFSKVAVEVQASEAIIHKEYHLSSADPAIMGNTQVMPLMQTNYDVADQLADVGMEAIHPKASKPLEIADIDLRIKNTFEPKHPGTLISNQFTGPESRVEIITGTDKVIIIEVREPTMVGEVGADLHLMQLFQKYSISYIVKSTNANSISMVIWEADTNKPLIKELRRTYETITVRKVAVVCTIGSNIAVPGMLAKAANALAKNKINIECISQSLRQVNMQFIIHRKDFNNAIKALHNALCSPDQYRWK